MGLPITLYRPVGKHELELIADSGYRRFPPRLPEQPIFYPVTNIEYARKIARDWNTKDAASGDEGHVLQFAIDGAFLVQFQLRTVGDSSHTEYWVPSERLEEFNAAIVGEILVVESYYASEKQ
jgi:hypothetical protein